jgi:poly(3-hydroxybutyrate) depolymerase
MIYQAYQAQDDLMAPLRAVARWMSALDAGALPPQVGALHAPLGAACRVLDLAQVTHKRPPWRIESVTSGGAVHAVIEESAHATPFATLLRFAKPGAEPQPKVLLVAPMSGHFATLLRETAKTLLADHDVYVTDWHNVRDVPAAAGRFGLDEYIEHLMLFLRAIGPGAHVVAVCQPCVAALAAVALMSEDDDPSTPASMTLMAGPIDCRVDPTSVNRLATSKPLAWFEKNLISRVPLRHAGALRRVYPGFVQLSAFIGMNRERHSQAFRDYYRNLLAGEREQAEVTRVFYEEYMAVADLSADFYLETVGAVFQEYALPLGKLAFRGRPIRPEAIRRTALLTVEGENDDICSVGQTLAAQDLCTGLRPYMRTHYVQPGVGHYGVFSGRRWQNLVYPVVRGVIAVSNHAPSALPERRPVQVS